MKKSKILNFLRGSSGGSKSGPDSDINSVTSTVSRNSTRKYNKDVPCIPTSVMGVPPLPGVERSSSWKYTPDHTPDSYSINSSPSILDGRTMIAHDDPSVVSIEKSQSWSGDRLLESADDSGSSRGGTNHSSRAGSCSRAGSRTGTMGSNISRERPSGASRSGSRMGSRVGSEHGDSTPSSIYDQEMQYTSYTDADGYENVELPSPRRTSIETNSNLSGSRLSVKGSTRRSRRPSPRRTPKKQMSCTGSSQDESGLLPVRGGSVKGVPSISLSTSSPIPLRGPRSPSVESNSSAGHGRRNLSRSPSRPHSRSPSQQQPNRPPSRASSRQSSRHSSRSPNRNSNQPEQWVNRYQNPPQGVITGGSRSMSYDETIPPPKTDHPNVPPLWKARSWQQYGQDGITPQIERARQLARTRWEQQQRLQQQQQQNQQLQRMDVGGKHQHVSRQEDVLPIRQTHVMNKSRSWQQSHESDLPPQEALHRTYTTNERRPRRTGSMRLTPHSQGHHPPVRSPLNPIVPPHTSPNQPPLNPQYWQHQIPQKSNVWEPQQVPTPPYQVQQPLQRQIIYNPQHQQLRSQRSTNYGYIDGSGQNTPLNASEYVELRDFEAMERKRHVHEQKKQLVRMESFRVQQPRPENYQGSHDQFIRSQFPQQVPLPQSQFPLNRKSSQKGRYVGPHEDEYASLQDVVNNRDPRFKGQPYTNNINITPHHRAPPLKASSLMTSAELLHTLKRQLAINSPSYGGRSKSMEAGRAAAQAMITSSVDQAQQYQQQSPCSPPAAQQHITNVAPGLTPALQALVAEKRARLKRSMGAFEGSRRLKGPAIQRQTTAPPTRCTVVHSPRFFSLGHFIILTNLFQIFCTIF